MQTPGTDERRGALTTKRPLPGSTLSPRALALVAAAVGSVGLIGLTLGIALDAARPKIEVGSQQVVNVNADVIPVEQGSAAATALAAQLASAGNSAITLNHELAVPAGQTSPVRQLPLFHSCKGGVDRAHCKVALLVFPPGEQPPMTSSGRVLLRGVFHASPVVDEQYGSGFLVQAAR
jgi:hypothetical protein